MFLLHYVVLQASSLRPRHYFVFSFLSSAVTLVASCQLLKRPEYFGQYGNIISVVALKEHVVATDGRPASAAAYIRFDSADSARDAIQRCDGFGLEVTTTAAATTTVILTRNVAMFASYCCTTLPSPVPRLADRHIMNRAIWGEVGGVRVHSVVRGDGRSEGVLGVCTGAKAQLRVPLILTPLSRCSVAFRSWLVVLLNTCVQGRTLHCSLGTSKYCNMFIKNLECTNAGCMYLHSVGEAEAVSTKTDKLAENRQAFHDLTHPVPAATVGGNPAIGGVLCNECTVSGDVRSLLGCAR